MDQEAVPDSARVVMPRIVTWPGEVDFSNSDRLGAELRREVRLGAPVVVADLSLTSFLDTAGLGGLLRAQEEGGRRGAELRVVVSSDGVRQILQLTRMDEVLKIYPDVFAAITSEMPSADGARERAS